ncbi:MAG: hypothetical protein HY736_15315 [Verrucomicrobia bacterium]|nr:hypothetical protein [Verrucomicrobiota bacterium]
MAGVGKRRPYISVELLRRITWTTILHRVAWPALGLLAGCAAPGDAPPPRARAATQQARAGEAAYLVGHPAEAVSALSEAVRLHLAAGDLPRAAHGLVNLALAQRAAGDAAGAAGTAARLRELAPAARQQAGERAGKKNEAAGLELGAATAWLDALLALDRGETATAASLLVAVTVTLPAASPWPGRIATLRADVALAEGRTADALALARTGVAACAAARDRSEEARAHRLMAGAHMRLAQWSEARASLLAAVRLEETLGAGERMARDLEQLAAIAEKLGDAAAAQLYAARARAIGSAR